MMVAIEAKNKEELQKVIKQHRLELQPSTIDWWCCQAAKGSQWYLCVSINDFNRQIGGGHVCTKRELGTIPILSFNEGVLIL